jgi:hypothetical protein
MHNCNEPLMWLLNMSFEMSAFIVCLCVSVFSFFAVSRNWFFVFTIKDSAQHISNIFNIHSIFLYFLKTYFAYFLK